MSLRFVAQQDNIDSVHEMILITNQQPSGTVLCYKTFFFYIGLQPSGIVPVIHYPVHRKHMLNSLKGKMIRKYCKFKNCVLNDLLHMKVHIWNDQ